MKVAEVMTRRVISVGPDSLIADTVRLMLQNDISGLPVVSARGDLVGMVTEGDFLRRTETGTERRRPRGLAFLLGPGRLADEYVHTHGRRVEEVMTRDVATVTEGTSLDEVVRLMESRRIKRLPVVRGRQIVGIVSRANLLRALAALITEATPRSRPTRPSASGCWRNWKNSLGTLGPAPTSSCGTASSIFGASYSTSGSARHCASPRRTCPASRRFGITSSGWSHIPASPSMRRKKRVTTQAWNAVEPAASSNLVRFHEHARR